MSIIDEKCLASFMQEFKREFRRTMPIEIIQEGKKSNTAAESVM